MDCGEKKVQKRNWVPLAYVLITICGIAIAYMLFWWGRQGLFWDSAGYYSLGEGIAREGLLHFSSNMRPYGYPLFVALVWTFTNHYPSIVRFAVFNVQLLLFVGVCFYASQKIWRSFKSRLFEIAAFAGVMLNPFLLVGTTELLADLLSAVLVFLSIVLVVKQPRPGWIVRKGNWIRAQRHIAIDAFFSFLVAGFSAMVRPANVIVVLVVAILWGIRSIKFKELSFRSLPIVFLGLAIPFIPQLINNYRAFGQIQPLIVQLLYSEQLSWGIGGLKYNAIAIPGQARGVTYQNPFLPIGVSTPLEFIQKHPGGFLLTEALHVFAMFDSEFVFPYILDLHPWYRWPLSLMNYSFLFFALGGIIAWGRRFLKRKRLDRPALIFVGFLLGSSLYLAGYVPVLVEERFAWPEYLLLSPFFAYGLAKIRNLIVDRWWVPVGVRTSALGAFVLGSVFLSNWIQAQAPDLFRYENADPLSHFVTSNLGISFGGRIELIGYALDPELTARGGDSLHIMFNWRCHGASTEPYEVQMDLIDSNGRIWYHGFHDTFEPISPCVTVPWGSGDEVADLISFRSSPAIPAGEYRIAVGIFDKGNQRYLDARTSSGQVVNGQVVAASIPIAKNKTSYTASDLQSSWPIEQPYFVDMGEMRLLGYTQVPDRVTGGGEIDFGLYWRARGKPRGDYLVAVQLRDNSKAVVFEQSARPAEGTYPTTLWDAGEVLLDWHDLVLPPDIPAGDYELVVELRDANSNQTLGDANITGISIVR